MEMIKTMVQEVFKKFKDAANNSDVHTWADTDMIEDFKLLVQNDLNDFSKIQEKRFYRKQLNDLVDLELDSLQGILTNLLSKNMVLHSFNKKTSYYVEFSRYLNELDVSTKGIKVVDKLLVEEKELNKDLSFIDNKGNQPDKSFKPTKFQIWFFINYASESEEITLLNAEKRNITSSLTIYADKWKVSVDALRNQYFKLQKKAPIKIPILEEDLKLVIKMLKDNKHTKAELKAQKDLKHFHSITEQKPKGEKITLNDIHKARN